MNFFLFSFFLSFFTFFSWGGEGLESGTIMFNLITLIKSEHSKLKDHLIQVGFA